MPPWSDGLIGGLYSMMGLLNGKTMSDDETIQMKDLLEFLERLVKSADNWDEDSCFKYVQHLFVSGEWRTKP